MKISLVGVPVQILVEVYEYWRKRSLASSEAFVNFIQNFDGLEVEAEEELGEAEEVKFFITDLSLIRAAMDQRCQEIGLWLAEAFSTDEDKIMLGEGDVAQVA